jgi:hypothetical protein
VLGRALAACCTGVSAIRHHGCASSRQALAALGTAARQDAASSRGFHALAKPVTPLANEAARLIGALHVSSPVSEAPVLDALDALGNRPDQCTRDTAVVMRFGRGTRRIAGAYMGQGGPKSIQRASRAESRAPRGLAGPG